MCLADRVAQRRVSLADADAEELATDLEAMGPTFVKLGQVMSTRPDLLEPETIDELRERIRKTVDFAETVKEAQYEGAGDRRVRMSWAPAGKVLGGQDYLLQMMLPNTFFHVTMAYAVLRHNGVDIGKMDFLGPINWIDP